MLSNQIFLTLTLMPLACHMPLPVCFYLENQCHKSQKWLDFCEYFSICKLRVAVVVVSMFIYNLKIFETKMAAGNTCFIVFRVNKTEILLKNNESISVISFISNPKEGNNGLNYHLRL